MAVTFRHDASESLWVDKEESVPDHLEHSSTMSTKDKNQIKSQFTHKILLSVIVCLVLVTILIGSVNNYILLHHETASLEKSTPEGLDKSTDILLDKAQPGSLDKSTPALLDKSAPQTEPCHMEVPTTIQRKGCEAGWRGYAGRCYQMFTADTAMTAADGRRICRDNGGDMALIKSKEDNGNMMEHVKLVKDVPYAYIGLSDSMEERNWQWLDGTPLTYSNWLPGQPNNYGGGQDWGMVIINWDSNSPGTWNDVGGEQGKSVFCEKQLLTEDQNGKKHYGELLGRYLNYKSFTTPPVDDLAQCLQQCTINYQCLSVNYLQTDTRITCHLLGMTRYDIGDLLEDRDMWRHLEVIHTRVVDYTILYSNAYSG